MQTAARPAPLDERGFWDRQLLPAVPVSREVALYAGLFVLAALLRFWDLGARMIHHDESLHATYSWYLYQGRGYTHNPMMHGPWQFVAMAASYFLLGASEAAARAPHALFGSALAVSPFFLRTQLGRAGALAAATFITLSPSFLYFSRFAREDAFAVAWTMLVVVALVRYLGERRPRDLYLLAAGLSLAYSTKENAYITSGIVLLFLLFHSVGERGGELLRFLANLPAAAAAVAAGRPESRGLAEPRLSPQGDLVVAITTLILPLFAAFVILPLRLAGVQGSAQDPVILATLLVLVGVALIVGSAWDRERWVRAAGIFWGIFIVLHTTFFTNPGGIYSGAIGALRYWIEQQGYARGEQPFYYYLLIVPLYEFVVVAFGVAGIVYWARRRNVMATFLIYWIVASQLIYAYTSEKMPWLVVHLALPFALLAGMTVGRLLERIDWRQVRARGGAPFALALLLAFAIGFAFVNRDNVVGSPLGTIAAQQTLVSWLETLALLAIVVGFAIHYGRRLGGQASRRLAAVVALGIALAFSVHTAWQASYEHGDEPVEMLVYVQTTRDVGKVLRQIEALTYRTGATRDTFRVAYDSGVTWPFEWYLRDYKARNFFGTGTPDADAPIVLVGFENDDVARVQAFLGDRYVGQRYRLRAWLDESPYREIATDPALLWKAIADPALRLKLWRFLLYREPIRPAGSTDFMVFVRRDLASGPWAAPLAAPPTPDEQRYAARTMVLPSVRSIGSRGSGEGQLTDPRGVALGPDGSVYVADTGNNRIAKFDSTGKFVLGWGAPGSGGGQFDQPWGIAVDKRGVVYVADWWNQRIQLFDAQGRFLAQWGAPGELYGPRGLAFAANGDLLVTDTGHHRVVAFGPDGKIVAQFGGRGGAPGQLNEPVGIAVDGSGNVFVADTWNRRIQVFDAWYRPIGQWPVAWKNSQSVVNKPYLAVDAGGNLYTTDPENGRVLEFDAGGTLLAAWGRPGADVASLSLPIGIAVDPATGGVFVADGGNGRVQVFGAAPAVP